MNDDTERAAWAAQQPRLYELVGDRLVLSPEHAQAPSRTAALRHVAEQVFGHVNQANTWLTTPSAALGGLSPADLAEEGDEGSQLALQALIRSHRAPLEPDDG